MEWRKMQEGLRAEIGRKRHRIGMDGEKSYRRPRYTTGCTAKEEEVSTSISVAFFFPVPAEIVRCIFFEWLLGMHMECT
jgi:hypothetical protein